MFKGIETTAAEAIAADILNARVQGAKDVPDGIRTPGLTLQLDGNTVKVEAAFAGVWDCDLAILVSPNEGTGRL